MYRRVLLALLFVCAAVLLPWTAYLARTLSSDYLTSQWRLAWVGFDIALVGCFAVAVWLGTRRRRAAVPLLAATAALLCADAWFDVSLGWAQPDHWISLLMAVGVELPLAAVLILRARLLLVGGMATRQLTVDDIALNSDPEAQRLLAAVRQAPASTTAEIAAVLTLAPTEVAAGLSRLAAAGHVERRRRGRWHLPTATNVRLPTLDETDAADRPVVAEYLRAKFEKELRLLTWAAERHDSFGDWGKGERATVHLTASELASLDAEYRDLVTRYCLLRGGPADGTREVAVRYYAFPMEQLDPPAANPAS